MNPYIRDCFSNFILSIKYEAQGKSPMTKCLLDNALTNVNRNLLSHFLAKIKNSFAKKLIKCNSILKEIFLTGGPRKWENHGNSAPLSVIEARAY